MKKILPCLLLVFACRPAWCGDVNVAALKGLAMAIESHYHSSGTTTHQVTIRTNTPESGVRYETIPCTLQMTQNSDYPAGIACDNSLYWLGGCPKQSAIGSLFHPDGSATTIVTVTCTSVGPGNPCVSATAADRNTWRTLARDAGCTAP